ncbi:DUF1761 domain-containing protein [Pseudovibrio flavus]|uniref:DUF1761 domain-containing protein n=1 Tax=Pseudovibrio flavus TaxID=2529854 RepID=UPI00211BB5E4|nr:DUF1761 domain-containing protein [Pseudovibrio flavus]
MNEIISNVNWVAVIVGAIASFMLGWLWYSPVAFGKVWASGTGVDLDRPEKMPALAMVSQFLGLFLMSWFVGVTAMNNALMTVVLATVAFAVLGFSGGKFGQKSTAAALIDFGYWIAALVVMLIVQGLF